MTDRTQCHYLLLQARSPGDAMAAHEHRCFIETLGVSPERIECWNLLQGAPDDAALERTDMLLIGGSGDYSMCGKQPPWIKEFIDFLADVCVGRDFPTFGSCFGFQGLVVAGGGEVISDPLRAEVGTFEIFLTDRGARDPLLGVLAPTFQAQEGHKDRASRLPAGVENLARSERVPYQAMRISGSVFATQFHPELGRDANTKRYLRYQAGYVEGGADMPPDDVLASMAPSPGATALLGRWADAILLDAGRSQEVDP